MTIKELSQLYYLNREIEREQCRLAELRTAATSTTARISGLPGIGSISDKTAIAAMIADTEAVIRAKTELAVVEYNRLNRYIASIPDSFMRQIISLRFVNGFTQPDECPLSVTVLKRLGKALQGLCWGHKLFVAASDCQAQCRIKGCQ